MELRWVRLIADGYSNAEMAKRLGTTANYVRSGMTKIYEKLGVGGTSVKAGSRHEPRILVALRYDREFRLAEKYPWFVPNDSTFDREKVTRDPNPCPVCGVYMGDRGETQIIYTCEECKL
jgi:ribosomal protein S27AE